MVISGPFAGVTGIFSSYRGDGRVIVNIEALGQFAAVNVECRRCGESCRKYYHNYLTFY
jgi:transcription antitermination factor NusG